MRYLKLAAAGLLLVIAALAILVVADAMPATDAWEMGLRIAGGIGILAVAAFAMEVLRGRLRPPSDQPRVP